MCVILSGSLSGQVLIIISTVDSLRNHKLTFVHYYTKNKDNVHNNIILCKDKLFPQIEEQSKLNKNYYNHYKIAKYKK